jgi:CheY-like chemotaxis protein
VGLKSCRDFQEQKMKEIGRFAIVTGAAGGIGKGIAEAGSSEVANKQPGITRGDHERVLLVDDEPVLVNLVSEILRRLDYLPVGYTSTLIALEAFRANPQAFDAVVTDESMPSLSGSELIRRMKTIRPEIPALLVSGYVSSAVLQAARDAGADDVLRKPIYVRQLGASLGRLLRREDGRAQHQKTADV